MKMKALVIGATGGMGCHVVPELLKNGYEVDGITMDNLPENPPDNLHYYKMNMADMENVKKVLQTDYDTIINFMHYNHEGFEKFYRLFLEHTKQYIFLSSYRVYANERVPITEDAPQLTDISTDEFPAAPHDYAVEKSLCEKMLKNSGFHNWTIVRPAIVIANTRFPLITVETAAVLNRANEHKKTLLPIQAKKVHASMIWSQDAGRLIANLANKKEALGEAFTIATGEETTWEEIVSYYTELAGLNPMWIDKNEHVPLMAKNPEDLLGHWRGLQYDRLFDRRVDNSKVLRVTGIKQSELMSIHDAIKTELAKVPEGKVWSDPTDVCKRMDEYITKHQ